MAPEVVVRKLRHLRLLLEELRKHADASQQEIESDPYRVERLLELLVTSAADLLTHLLAERGEHPQTYREAFRLAGQQGLLGRELSGRLQGAAGMRNVLVHLYEEIDYGILHESVSDALQDFPELIRDLEPLAGEPRD